MKRTTLATAVAGALALCAGAAATAQDYRTYYDQNYTYRLGRAPEWNLNAPDGQCRLRIWVDDKAQVQLRGDQIIVNTNSGRRSFDQGSVCTQPLPFGRVEDFKVTAQNARGRITEVRAPTRRNNFTGSVGIDDPQSGGDTYDLVVSWRNPDAASAPVASNDAYPFYDETRACQDRVRRDFLAKNADDAYLEFTPQTTRDEAGPNRERIRGDAWARNRDESHPLSYECLLNDRTNRVLSATYEMRGRSRYSSLY